MPFSLAKLRVRSGSVKTRISTSDKCVRVPHDAAKVVYFCSSVLAQRFVPSCRRGLTEGASDGSGPSAGSFGTQRSSVR